MPGSAWAPPALALQILLPESYLPLIEASLAELRFDFDPVGLSSVRR